MRRIKGLDCLISRIYWIAESRSAELGQAATDALADLSDCFTAGTLAQDHGPDALASLLRNRRDVLADPRRNLVVPVLRLGRGRLRLIVGSAPLSFYALEVGLLLLRRPSASRG